jgi:hypothetical protein
MMQVTVMGSRDVETGNNSGGAASRIQLRTATAVQLKLNSETSLASSNGGDAYVRGSVKATPAEVKFASAVKGGAAAEAITVSKALIENIEK